MNKLKQSFVYNIKLCIMCDIFLIPAKKKLAKKGLEDLTKAVPIEYIYKKLRI